MAQTITTSTTLSQPLTAFETVVVTGGPGVTVTATDGFGLLSFGDNFTVEDGATLVMNMPISENIADTLNIGTDGTLVIKTGFDINVATGISFTSGTSGGDLIIKPGSDLNLFNTIAGFGFGDKIDFEGVGTPALGLVGTSFDSFYDQTVFTVDTSTGSEQFALTGNYTGDVFTATNDGDGGFILNEDTPCFVSGTRILTTDGEIEVEHLSEGDVAVLADGTESEVVFIGFRRLNLARHAKPDMARPVRIPAGALADGIPGRDLLVSPDHALFLDGVLVPARDLIDGAMIKQDRTIQRLCYYHVELATHGVLLAEGAPAESFLNVGHRGLFENVNQPIELHPELMHRERETNSVVPLVTSGPQLAIIRSRLHERALQLGYRLVEKPALTLRVGETIVVPSKTQDGDVTFALPEGATEVTVLSAVFSPAEVNPASLDRRVLGVAIARLKLNGVVAGVEEMFNPDDLHARDTNETASWTRGPARLTVPAGTRTLTLGVAGWPTRWQKTAAAAPVPARQDKAAA